MLPINKTITNMSIFMILYRHEQLDFLLVSTRSDREL